MEPGQLTGSGGAVAPLPQLVKLYAIPVSLYSAKTRIALRHKGLVWEDVLPPGGYGSAEYKRIVASGNLPALDDGGLLIADSEAIAEYLEDQYPDPPLMPQDPALRARMRERSRFHDTRLEPELRRLFPHIAPEARDADLAAQQSAAISQKLAQLAHLLDQAPAMEFGLGDCGLPVTFAWIDALLPRLGLRIDWPDTVRGYETRIRSAPAVAAELAAYEPLLRAWLDQQGA